MAPTLDNVEVREVPVYAESWTVARIPGFVAAVLNRWQREHGELPARFHMAMCPQVEVNAMGGLPSRVHELTDPRLTCRHFTGCHKPYLVVIFVGDDADSRRQQAQELLSWSEGYAVEKTESAVQLTFAGCTEEVERDEDPRPSSRRLQELLESGELIRILE